jgi:AraC-like DNA-binding protein
MHSKLDFIADWKVIVQDGNYEPSRVAEKCNVSLRQLERFFQARFGLTPKAWMDELRFQQAIELISAGEPVKSTAYKLGFKQPTHFSRAFRQLSGMSPRAYASQLVETRNIERSRQDVEIR